MSALSVAVVVYVIGVIICGVVAGIIGLGSGDYDDDLWLFGGCAFVWPMTLPLAILIMTFYGFVYLGRRIGGHE